MLSPPCSDQHQPEVPRVDESDSSDWETDEEELVHVELSGIFQDDLLKDLQLRTKFIGLETDEPMLQIGGQTFIGKYQHTQGTSVFFKQEALSEEELAAKDAVFEKQEKTKIKYHCKTDQKLVLKRVFLNPKESSAGKKLQAISLKIIMTEEDSSSSADNSGGGAGPNPGRRPMNAFLLFCKKHRTVVKEHYPNVENRSITKILGDFWSHLLDEEKAAYVQLANEIKEEHRRTQPNFQWRKQPVNHVHNISTSTASTAAAAVVNSTSNGVIAVSKNGGEDTGPAKVASANPAARMSPELNASSRESPPTVAPATNSASKPFKKRFQAAEAELFSSGATVSPEADQACKALLQLAGVRESSPAEEGGRAGSNGNSRSGTSSPPNGDESSLNKPAMKKTTLPFGALREAVLGKVAKTLLKQNEERGNGSVPSDGEPLNLSSQCTIQGQTIIEHIIENILEKPMGEAGARGMNNNTNGVSESEAEGIKERIFQGLKKDFLSEEPTPERKEALKALWNTLPTDKLVKKNQSDTTSAKKKTSSSAPAAASDAGKPVPLTVNTDSTSVASSTANNSVTNSTANISIHTLLMGSGTPSASPPGQSSGPSSVSISLVPSTEVSPSGAAAVAAAAKPLNLSTTPPQTPLVSLTPVKGGSGSNDATATTAAQSALASVTITATSPAKRKLQLEEDDDDIRRSSRSCKGKRYQEFKDEGRLGKNRRSHKSGELYPVEGDTLAGLQASSTKSARSPPRDQASNVPSNGSVTASTAAPAEVDYNQKLNALPLLSLEVYQQRIKSKSSSSSSPVSALSGTKPTTVSLPGGLQSVPANDLLSAASSSSRRRSAEPPSGNEIPPKKAIRRSITAKSEGGEGQQQQQNVLVS